ncbi:hypothetical protein ABLE68_17740 [Nocardioides sp. CN2-186]|uniref:hypothetical protein n=1 Tax=Nocardioides tweenelious TaxID=3156607 RepID=UPI0032B4147A
MMRTALVAAAVVAALSAPTASVADIPVPADPAGASAAPFGAPLPATTQRVLPQRLLMRQVPTQRVAGLTQHVKPSCTGDGTDGDRVQVLYVHSSAAPPGLGRKRDQILDEVRTVDDVFAASAAKTGGGLRVRWVHGARCVPVIDDVTVSPAAIKDGWDVMQTELRALGYDRSDRKYLAFTESTRNCGLSDGNVPGSISRVDAPCWPLTGTAIAAHELGHGLGAVAGDAPHYSGWGHCNEAADLMCNGEQGDDDPVVRTCPSWQRNWFDCGNDDYFSTDPAPGSYLDSSRNIARSPFLDTVPALPAPPAVRVTAAPAAATGSRTRQGQTVTVRAVADESVTGWSFPNVAGSCRLVTSSDVSRVGGSATYSCLQKEGSTASITVQALGTGGRVGYGSGRVVLRTAPVSVEVAGQPVAGQPFTVQAFGGDDHVFWRWAAAPGCRKRVHGPVADFTCPPRMSGSSISLGVTAFRLNGDPVSARRTVRLAG